MRRITGLIRVLPGVIATIVIAVGCHDGLNHHPSVRRTTEFERSVVATPIVDELPPAATGELVAVTTEEPAARAAATFLVGDSTMVEAALVTGTGSAFDGHGFSRETPYGLRNPLVSPAEDYEGVVVLGVSVWDVWATDLSGYQEATDHYRSLGHDVVWIEVPPTSIPYAGGPLNPELQSLNAAVADHLGCELQPWTLRNVESYGFAGEDHPDDWLHPTPSGGSQIVANVSSLSPEQACIPRTSS